MAKLHIPPQTFTTQDQQTFCENLSMNPWHGVGDWLPLGSLSKARRLVYQAVSQYRHQQNDAVVFQPTSWCLGNTTDCNPADFFHQFPPPWPLQRCFDALYQPVDGQPAPAYCQQP